MWGDCVHCPGNGLPPGSQVSKLSSQSVIVPDFTEGREIWSEILILLCQVLIVMFSSVFCFSLKGEVVCYLCFKSAIEIYLIYLLTCYAVLLNFLSWVRTSMLNWSPQHIYLYLYTKQLQFPNKMHRNWCIWKIMRSKHVWPQFFGHQKHEAKHTSSHGWTVKLCTNVKYVLL